MLWRSAGARAGVTMASMLFLSRAEQSRRMRMSQEIFVMMNRAFQE
jgi:hypothetical protein